MFIHVPSVGLQWTGPGTSYVGSEPSGTNGTQLSYFVSRTAPLSTPVKIQHGLHLVASESSCGRSAK